jgi:hypothetical protein
MFPKPGEAPGAGKKDGRFGAKPVFGLLLIELGKAEKEVGGGCGGCFKTGMGRVGGVRVAGEGWVGPPVKGLLTGLTALKMLLRGGLAARLTAEKKEF